jgi:hypothetical protein
LGNRLLRISAGLGRQVQLHKRTHLKLAALIGGCAIDEEVDRV